MERQSIRNRLWGAATVLALSLFAYWQEPGMLAYKDNAIVNIPALFGYLVLVSMVVERATEIFLSAWRSQEADQLDRQINAQKRRLDTLKEDAAAQQQALAELDQVERARTLYRAGSRQIAQWIGLVIGTLVSLVGVRILANLVDAAPLPYWQHQLFVAVDVLLTGAVLAGGSDAVNKIMKVYTSAMDNTAEKMRSRDTAPKP
ncbi:hypothetical protein [Gallaecimonas xiamenensis]|uniref:Uncharacterized protein n=1 Tax=Gallaecimonas xiamenensis 3-C-1 TaxID=745411 RepID=K2IFH6_9GAMM|nr:hypothetical protein [Gallaecimonas xiamenensis]EKE68766.1 hypothetical protein B3C1_16430 [Gallaecimonas xiamenensis 3-C-1]